MGAKDGGCPVFSLRCRGTCLGRGIWKQAGQEEEAEVGGFSKPAWRGGGSNTGDGDGGGDGGGPDTRDNMSRQT